MDLSNYLLIRMRERLLLESKVHSPQIVLAKGKSKSSKFHQECLEAVKTDIRKSILDL